MPPVAGVGSTLKVSLQADLAVELRTPGVARRETAVGIRCVGPSRSRFSVTHAASRARFGALAARESAQSPPGFLRKSRGAPQICVGSALLRERPPGVPHL